MPILHTNVSVGKNICSNNSLDRFSKKDKAIV